MLEGWYCRNSRIANEQASQNHNQSDDNSSEEESQDGRNFNQVNYKSQYRYLKQKLKFLLYENEFFQDALRSSQRRLLKVSRDRSFLLDRLLQYEKPEGTSSESDETESSEEELLKIEPKKRKLENNTTPGNSASKNHVGGAKKKKLMQPKGKPQNPQIPNVQTNHGHDDGHMMTAEEVERHLNHLQSRQIIELVPERAPPTVPTEMFSNEPSLDSESNDQLIETSPSNLGEDCLSVDMSIVKCEYKME